VEILPEAGGRHFRCPFDNNHFVVLLYAQRHSRVRLYDLNGKLVKNYPAHIGYGDWNSRQAEPYRVFPGLYLLPLSHSELEVRLRYGRVGVLCEQEYTSIRISSSEPGSFTVQGWDNGFHVFGAQKAWS